jgi:uncharacterized membrane protein
MTGNGPPPSKITVLYHTQTLFTAEGCFLIEYTVNMRRSGCKMIEIRGKVIT